MIIYEALNTPVVKAIPVGCERILDLGCGSGALGAEIKRHWPAEVIGVTRSATEAALAGEKLDRVIIADLDVFEPTAELGVFDGIVCSHVLEHLRDPARLLHSLQPCLRPGGRMIIALPNLLYWKQRMQFIMGRFRYTQRRING
jgi:2-polyprenyl-3-methyl-5-hydroxy-6-metoxy-1,4-benzoquinol methylase